VNAAACPPWCARNGEHRVHAGPCARADGIQVCLVGQGGSEAPVVQLAYAGEVTDASALVSVPACEAAAVLAPVLARLGHPQLAAAITAAARAGLNEGKSP
jgi:hypothetical protein